MCKNTCLGQEVGVNHKCWRNASLGPTSQLYAVTDTCALDDNGNLYSSESASGPCTNGCTDGVCDTVVPSLDCQVVGGRGRDAFTIGGAQECKNTCLGTQAGANTVCYHNASTGPTSPWYVITDTCVADDNGRLYSSGSTTDQTCPDGCTNGACDLELICLSVDGGRAQNAYTIGGVRMCKNTCLGTNAGKNKACWSDAAPGSSATVYAVIDTCALDDNGDLYSSDSAEEPCANGCKDGACNPEISLNCEGLVGGRAQKTVTIKGKQQCKDVCLGTAMGDNVKCYQNASSGPDSPWYLVTDKCTVDDNGVLYSAREPAPIMHVIPSPATSNVAHRMKKEKRIALLSVANRNATIHASVPKRVNINTARLRWHLLSIFAN